ncbi:MAG: META domain-containing protein [Anaerolineae bacterium]|nr:META domain-containing protein [Anaerolineae bacterium]NIN98941.1 META domain-containing protein [Anaerolineae bacterium]
MRNKVLWAVIAVVATLGALLVVCLGGLLGWYLVRPAQFGAPWPSGMMGGCSGPGGMMGGWFGRGGMMGHGTEWVLQSVDGSSPLAGTEITLAFCAGIGEGFAGCNTYAGRYSVEGEDGLSFSGLANTEMACLEPVGIMDQEEKYLEALRAATGFRLSDGELQIFSAEGVVLVYSQAQ